jgi:hypothetical protein
MIKVDIKIKKDIMYLDQDLDSKPIPLLHFCVALVPKNTTLNTHVTKEILIMDVINQSKK